MKFIGHLLGEGVKSVRISTVKLSDPYFIPRSSYFLSGGAENINQLYVMINYIQSIGDTEGYRHIYLPKYRSLNFIPENLSAPHITWALTIQS